MELSDEDSNFEMIEMSTIILEIGKYLASSFDFCCILPVYCKAQKLTENMLIQFDLLASKNDSARESQTRQNCPFFFFYFAFLRETKFKETAVQCCRKVLAENPHSIYQKSPLVPTKFSSQKSPHFAKISPLFSKNPTIF